MGIVGEVLEGFFRSIETRSLSDASKRGSTPTLYGLTTARSFRSVPPLSLDATVVPAFRRPWNS